MFATETLRVLPLVDHAMCPIAWTAIQRSQHDAAESPESATNDTKMQSSFRNSFSIRSAICQIIHSPTIRKISFQ
jgi:hypothetical protein